MALVLVFLVATHLVVCEPTQRAEWQYRIVIALGWGHLLAALGRGRDGWRAWTLALSASAGVFALYAALLERWPVLPVLLLAVSTWHTMENEWALGRASPRGLALGPLPRTLREHLPALGATAVVGLLVLGTEEGSALMELAGAAMNPWLARWLGLSDLFVVVTLHHLLVWLLRTLSCIHRAKRRQGWRVARPLLRWLLVTHLPPMLLCAALAVVHTPCLDPLRTLVLAPGVYLFWSLLHVVQTAWARGLAPPAPDPADASSCR